MKDLQTVLDALEDAGYYDSAITIVKQMMQAKPVAWLYVPCVEDSDRMGIPPEFNVTTAHVAKPVPEGRDTVQPLYAAPQATPVSDEHGNVKSSAGLIRDGKVDRFVKSYFAAPKAVPASNQPVAWRVWSPDGTNVYQYNEDGDGEPLYTAPKGAV